MNLLWEGKKGKSTENEKSAKLEKATVVASICVFDMSVWALACESTLCVSSACVSDHIYIFNVCDWIMYEPTEMEERETHTQTPLLAAQISKNSKSWRSDQVINSPARQHLHKYYVTRLDHLIFLWKNDMCFKEDWAFGSCSATPPASFVHAVHLLLKWRFCTSLYLFVLLPLAFSISVAHGTL